MSVEALEQAKPYQAVDGDTLETIAARESSSGNALTAEQIARFNWGTDDPEEVQTFMRDKLGARRRGADNRYIISTDDEPTEPLVIPRRFRREGLVVEKVHTLRVLTKRSPKQFLACCHIPGITFAFDKSFVRASVRDHLKELERLAQEHSEAKIMIFGHTDLVGSDVYNKKLSERRAWAVHAYIINDADAWETLYNHSDEDWGVAEIQEMLAALGHDPGPIDGQMGSQTRTAMRSFLGLPEDAPVSNDAAFRKQLFAAYMAGKGDVDLPAERFADPAFMGCGEFNPVKQVQGPHEPNRRVTFFLFHQDRVPTLPCKLGDVNPCRRQIHAGDPRHFASFRCSFYDSLAKRCGRDKPGPTPDDRRLRSQCLRDSLWLHETLNGRRVVKSGTNAPDAVRRLQVGLLWLENSGDLGTTGVNMLDGKYTATVEHAVKEFQQQVGLAVDGRVSARTVKKMDERLVVLEQSDQAASLPWS